MSGREYYNRPSGRRHFPRARAPPPQGTPHAPGHAARRRAARVDDALPAGAGFHRLLPPRQPAGVAHAGHAPGPARLALHCRDRRRPGGSFYIHEGLHKRRSIASPTGEPFLEDPVAGAVPGAGDQLPARRLLVLADRAARRALRRRLRAHPQPFRRRPRSFRRSNMTAQPKLKPSLMLVDGKWEASADGRFIPVENPAKRQAIAEVPRAGAADVDRAVRAAAKAFAGWRNVPPRERGRLLMKIADSMEAESEALAKLIATETGNALRTQSRPEAKGAADLFRYFGGLASELKGETVPLGEHVLSYTRREPIGVVGAVIPWNSPVALGAMKIAMSLAAGNTLVLKAAEDAPLGVLRMAELCAEHLPAGVLNVLTGYGEEAGEALVQHPLVRKLSFTGSTEVGKLIMHAAADRIVPVSLELGGKSPCVVFPDSNDERTVEGVVSAMRFTRQGQSCTAGSRLFLHK